MEYIVLQPQVVGLDSFHEGVDHSASLRIVRGIGEQPALAPHDEGADGVLHLVIADFDLAVVQEGAEIFLLVKGIGNRVLHKGV